MVICPTYRVLIHMRKLRFNPRWVKPSSYRMVLIVWRKTCTVSLPLYPNNSITWLTLSFEIGFVRSFRPTNTSGVWPGNRLKWLKMLDNLIRHRNDAWSFHLHHFSKYLPEPLFKINIRPERKTQFLSLTTLNMMICFDLIKREILALRVPMFLM